MSTKKDKVVIAMSGGVDSSVAACLLVEQGYDVIGLFMRTGIEEPAQVAQSDIAATNPNECSAHGTGATGATGGLPPLHNGGEDSIAAHEIPDRHRGCCSANDAADARYVAGMLGIPFYVLNFEKDFDRLIDYFADEYARGRTPNPCIVCNDALKFGRLVEYADAAGAKHIATGHYARIQRGMDDAEVVNNSDSPAAHKCHNVSLLSIAAVGGHHDTTRLLRAIDHRKDQSYVLFGLDRAILDRLIFPIGELTKRQVRQIAERFGLPNRDKPDSVEICFVPDNDYARVVKERRPDAFEQGNVLNQEGEVIGKHKGVGHYTVGQRRGLGIAAGEPIYVTQLNVETNTVTMGRADALLHSTLIADRVNLLADVPRTTFRAEAKIRYLHKPAPAAITWLDDHRVEVHFDQPQRAITPGQAVVFYHGDAVLGGAWIESIKCD